MVELKRAMFREYDVRGRVSDEELNDRAVAVIARAYGTMLRRREIGTAVVGYDYREESEHVAGVAVEALTSTGIDVINLGMVLTPMLYWAQYRYASPGGMMVTASHNPSGWSGFKLAQGYSQTLGPVEMEELYETSRRGEFATGTGQVRTIAPETVAAEYEADLVGRVAVGRSPEGDGRPLRVVVNAGNGTPAAFVPRILRAAGCEVEELYCDLDWSFPHYFPNPAVVEMMEDTGRKVVETGADIGFAIDGDGDRLGVTNERGETVWPDRYLILLARQILERNPGAKIIFDVKCSQALVEDIAAHGGQPIMWKTGHSYIKQKLWEERAPLAGEMSGHLFYGAPEYYGFDDSVFAALKLAETLSGQRDPFSALIAKTPYYVSTPALQVACGDEVKYGVVERLTQEFKAEGYKVNDINGARVEFGDGWGLVRASSNLPVLVLRFEARSEERRDEIAEIFRQKFDRYPEIGTEWESG